MIQWTSVVSIWQMTSPLFRFFKIQLTLLLLATPLLATVPEKPDFNFHVQPILSDRCYFCHGADASHQKAGLRLDQRESATKAVKSGAIAIVPGDPEKSELIKRIYSHDPDEVMPVPSSKLTMTDEEREILKRWIAQGAEYKRHWAFEAPKLPAIPAVTSKAGPLTNPIDSLVAERLQKEGLDLNKEASRDRLLRRASLDLTGLPPTLAELDAFVADSSPDAFEKQVDRLLAAPAFGERMAQDWLDVARFADTFGYQSDVTVQNWPYRDWVIKSFNDNLPYDQFITQQLAGDLLPDPTRDQVVATAFNRLHRQTNEGGSIDEEFRVEYVNDRVQTFGLAFLGLTLECCRCHDHKYDPITTKDFYSLSAFFANIDESGLYSHFTNAVPTPTLKLTNAQQQEKLAALLKSITEQETVIKGIKPTPATTPLSMPTPLARLTLDKISGGKFRNEANEKEPAATSDVVTTVDGKIGHAALLTGENNIHLAAGGAFTRDDAFSFAFWMKTPDVKERAVIFHRSKAWSDAGSCGYELLIENGKLSAALIHFWPGNAMRVVVKQPLPINEWTHVVWSYDGSSKAAGLKLFINGKLAELDIVRDALTKDINRGGENQLTIGQRFRDKGFKNGMIDDFAIYNVALTAFEARQCFARASIQPTPEELAETSLIRQNAEFLAAQTKLSALRKERSKVGDGIQELMVMKEMATPKPAYILKRGAYDSHGDPVTADVPTAILPFKPEWTRNRLGLAKWVTDPANPLTARVVVNRFWQGLWGTGLVATAEDFGLQGRLPTHPELLDYLSAKFVQSGWNVKSLIREIVLSKTYRQDSTVPAEVRAKDIENKLLSRGPKVRLSAEAVRDQALAVSQQLDTKLGGPSVDPDKAKRRSLYTFWKRTMPDVRMEIFDMAKREVCIARRQTTNTPLQALTLLNEPKFLEAARVLAQKTMLATPDLEGRLRSIWRSLTSQLPSAGELKIMQALYSEQLADFQQGDAAKSFLATTGAHVNATLPPAELAAMTAVSSAVMNLDSAIMKR